ncbi:MAG: GNAT family N-acetyltransferase [Ideonella sp.]|jgi:ribosomal protein S18 acetylase RimI-like enzyme|nr:GNAT family N-acetyltransferase [Ideonella sp.]
MNPPSGLQRAGAVRPAEQPRRVQVVDARADDLPEVRGLLREYATGLGVDLCFQGFEAELAELPGAYAAPQGALLLARVEGEPAACGAMRPLPGADPADACEMKRLYVRPAFRGRGLGRSLAVALMERASQAGYSVMLLDTLDDMAAARGLYATLGFVEVPAYYVNPIPGAHYLKAVL